MPQIEKSTVTIAASGTLSSLMGGNGRRLVGLYVPTVDSTTIGFEMSTDGGTTFATVKTNSGSIAAVTLGSANTGGQFQAVPEEVGKLFAVFQGHLVVASQTGGARSLIALWEAP